MASATKQWDVIVQSTQEDFTRIASIDNIVSFDKEAKFALQIITQSEYLQKATTESLRNAIVNVASVGLTLNPAMKLAYLVPRDGRAYLDISYIGLQKLATDTGSVAAVSAELVYEKDEFEYLGPFQKPVHKFNPFKRKDRGEIVGVYVIARLVSGVDQITTLDMEEIDKIRAKSKAKTGPWKDWFEEMVKKSAIKRASKAWPRTERLAAAEQILNEHEGLESPIAGRGVEAGRTAQQAERGAVDATAALATLQKAATQGLAAYAKAWAAITKQERVALKNEHTALKEQATKADAQDVPFTDIPDVGPQDIPTDLPEAQP